MSSKKKNAGWCRWLRSGDSKWLTMVIFSLSDGIWYRFGGEWVIAHCLTVIEAHRDCIRWIFREHWYGVAWVVCYALWDQELLYFSSMNIGSSLSDGYDAIRRFETVYLAAESGCTKLLVCGSRTRIQIPCLSFYCSRTCSIFWSWPCWLAGTC